ncbi:hypothetical protein PO124_08380 [Bacillus licheniformis]|nr:hypothetical protein [Bacillus licheniformis]
MLANMISTVLQRLLTIPVCSRRIIWAIWEAASTLCLCRPICFSSLILPFNLAVQAPACQTGGKATRKERAAYYLFVAAVSF